MDETEGLPEGVELTVTEGLSCPTCGVPEVEIVKVGEAKRWQFNIRAYRVGDADGVWWSQCMKCAETDPTKGWFK